MKRTMPWALGALIACLGGCTARDAAVGKLRTIHLQEAAPAAEPAPSVAALRAKGPPALARLLAAYDDADASERAGLESVIDQVAAQRYATVSRLFWHTDLDAAKAEAQRSHKPILSLRMLGRLDEELSCANSRFFRTVLYANVEVSRLLRERFVLHWSSERPVPRVTIDYGDGRKLVRTVTGNSAHYVLDAHGRPLDVLPGLYLPQVFREELELARALHDDVADLDGRARSAALVTHHDQHRAARMQAWEQIGQVAIVDDSALTPEQALARAQRATMSKAAIEVRDLRLIDLGSDPGKLDDGLPLWSTIGQRLFGVAGSVIDAQSRALVIAIASAPAPGEPALDGAQLEAMLARLEATLIADSALNEMRLRPQIIAELARNPTVDFETLNAWVYANAFATPASDRWLGLLPRASFMALPGDGVVTATTPRAAP